MRIALLTDIHANREAFDACLAAVEAAGADRIVILGDLVGYGPDPAYVVDRCRALAEAGAVVIKGNHDEAMEKGTRGMADHAARALEWTRAALDEERRAWLAALPLQHRDGEILYVHASARAPAEWHYLTDLDEAGRCLAATDARLVFCGHTHVPVIFHGLAVGGGGRPKHLDLFIPLPGKPVPFSSARRYAVVVGSVGQPRDRNPAACWALHDIEERSVTMLRAAYDIDATVRKIKDAGLADWLGRRLYEGR